MTDNEIIKALECCSHNYACSECQCFHNGCKWLTRIRYKLAYFIAPDWIDDLESRFSAFLCEQTGGHLSKCYYPLNVMLAEANDYQQSVCDECEYCKEWRADYERTATDQPQT